MEDKRIEEINAAFVQIGEAFAALGEEWNKRLSAAFANVEQPTPNRD